MVRALPLSSTVKGHFGLELSYRFSARIIIGIVQPNLGDAGGKKAMPLPHGKS
jgi:hypothetical protein